MNWITKNNYTIKRKFNQINNKRGNKELKKAFTVFSIAIPQPKIREQYN